MVRVFDIMRWSFAALNAGKWPALDWLGVPIDYSKRMGEVWGEFCFMSAFMSLMNLIGARQTHTPKSYVSPYESYEYNATPPHAGRQRPR